MTDIIATVAWSCDDKDCPAQWHKANYWIDGRGYTVDWYGDGDHERVRKRDLPTYAEIVAAWLEYARYVLRTGTDPLDEYLRVKAAHTVTERWRFHLVPSILGVVCAEARQGRRRVLPADFPSHVRAYLNLDPAVPSPVLRDFPTWADLAPAGITLTARGWTAPADITRTQLRAPHTIARELRREARRHLKTSKETP